MKKALFRLCLLPILLLPLLLTGCADREESDAAMQKYLTTMAAGDVTGFLNMVSQEKNFRFCSYDGKTGNEMGQVSLDRAELITKIMSHGGLYFALFEGTDDYRYIDRIKNAPFSEWEFVDNFYRWHKGSLKSYVRWQKEAAGWRIIEIGDTVP